ncbi:S-layer homology domain-containing protein [Cohnella sp. REN36]|uniref:S-layer homology domain-containing protein n=1 Tax=Cohnella sp. REN36 TaxID=2887347 RepID=UPI001D153346|nr:S-layer homology domain-containing protein [Cohnella sp. REN36]MCC3375064.1 S-layer homology domain-containing protein [Cohnella sp. REN36]
MRRVLSWFTALMLAIGIIPIHAFAASSDFAQGDGSAERPYIVTTLAELNAVRNDLSAHYRLAADIDASETAGWDGGRGFEPIGSYESPFTGDFDGDGHLVAGLAIKRPEATNIGLFGVLGQGKVRRLGLENAEVEGGRRVGGLVGYMIGGELSAVYSTGHVSGHDDYTGGLVGWNEDGRIAEAYSTATVDGNQFTGGLAGYNRSAQAVVSDAYFGGRVRGTAYVGGVAGRNLHEAKIRTSYVSGAVSGSTYVGGIVGLNDNKAMVETSYWDIETTGVPIGAGATLEDSPFSAAALFTLNALRAASYAGFDFERTWFMIDGSTRPFLRSEWSATIRNAHQLQLVAMDLKTNYTLARDIDFGDVFTDDSRSDMWATNTASDGTVSGLGFVPLGNNFYWAYEGRFDGQGHVVRGLTIHRPGANGVGLFGMLLGPNGIVRDVGMEGGSVTGGENTGALVGFNNAGTIESSYANVPVRGTKYVGGLAGNNGNNAKILQSYASGDVTGNASVGGLVGFNYRLAGGGLVTESYAIGRVTGQPDGGTRSSNIGGLVGENADGVIEKSYATGPVSGQYQIGGAVGVSSADGRLDDVYASGRVSGDERVGGAVGMLSGPLNRAYASGDVEGQVHAGGLAGETTASGSINDAYATGSVEGSDKIGGLVGMLNGPVNRAYATGRAAGRSFVGGLAGRTEEQAKIRDAYAVGPVEGQFEVGGLVGRNVGSIERAYAAGRVTGSEDVGGLVGRAFGTATMSYFDRETTGRSGGTGTADMKRQETFASWDFEQTWTLQAGKAYPVLRSIPANLALDAAPPTVAGAEVDVERPDRVVAVFDEEVTAVGAGGMTIRADGISVPIARVEGSGTKALTIVIDAPVAYGQAVDLSYDAGAGAIADLAGHPLGSFANLVAAFVDRTPPQIAIAMTTADGKAYEDGAWTDQAVTVSAAVSDRGSVSSVTYSLDGEASWSPYAGEIVLRDGGIHPVAVRAVDAAGNEAIERRTVKISTGGLLLTPTLTKEGGGAYRSGEWTNASVTVSVYAAGGAGEIADFVYTLDGGDAIAYANDVPIAVADEGVHTLVFRATDEAGAVALTLAVKVDRTPPEVAIAPNGGDTAASVAPTVSATDTWSGIDAASLQYVWTKDPSSPADGWTTFANGSALAKTGADGDWYLHVRARDRAGNETVATSGRFRLTVPSGSGPSGGGSPSLPDHTYRVGTEGGTIVFAGGEIVIPAGATTQSFLLMIQPVAPGDVPPANGGDRLASGAFSFTKDLAGTFAKDVTIRLLLNGGTQEAEDVAYLLSWYDEASGAWVPLSSPGFDPERHSASGTTRHFTMFAVIAHPVAKEEPAAPFADVKGHWAAETIAKLAAAGAVNGYADGSFRPDRTVTRAEYAAMLVRALGLADQTGKAFADLQGHWASQAVSTAYANGIVQGIDEETFAPDRRITREQMAVMTANALKLKTSSDDVPFADRDRISAWAKQVLAAATEYGLLSGYPDGTARPQGQATRAEAAAVIWRALALREKS